MRHRQERGIERHRLGRRAPTRSAGRKLSALTVVGTLLLAAGCSDGDAQPPPPPPPPPKSATPTVDPDQPVYDRAAGLAAHHDYRGAVETLRPLGKSKAEQLIADYQQADSELQVWPHNDKISHLFFHTLIIDTERAFDHDGEAAGYDDYMVTKGEFAKILDQLYAKGYVLVSPHDIARPDPSGKMQFTEIRLPAGKKPLVISQDDVSYYEYMDGDGFARDLMPTPGGGVTNNYVDPSGATVQGAYDMVPMMDDFIDAHPDFSYHGHKGVLAMTGYNGVLGYRTSARKYGRDPDFAEQQQKATEAAAALKADGWEFASHTWGHINTTKDSMGLIKADSKRWNTEVRPILGDTDLLIFPFGADISKGSKPYAGPRYGHYKADGFRYFFGVDATTEAWSQLHGEYLRQARINVDGIRLKGNVRGREKSLDPFFDSRSVIDPARPK